MHGGPHDSHAHHHHGRHDHDHARGANQRAVATGFLLTASFMLVEVAGGILSGSLALLADAGHMLTDAAGLALAWAGFRIAARAPDPRRTFGYARFEVLAGFVNALALFAITGWIGVEAVRRLQAPGEVLAGPMLAVAVTGLCVNILVFRILAGADRDHVNIRGAMLHVLGDLLGSVGAIVAAVTVWLTGWTPIDPILSILVAMLILRAAWRLLAQSMHILLEGAPAHIDADALRRDLVEAVPGVADVHHLHLWSISSGRTLATLHVETRMGCDPFAVLPAAQQRLRTRWAIDHATIQVEPPGGCGPAGRC